MPLSMSGQAGYIRNPRLITKIMTEEKLGVDRRRPEKSMNLPQREISWGWGQKCATDTQLSMEIQPEKAQHSHPEQHATG